VSCSILESATRRTLEGYGIPKSIFIFVSDDDQQAEDQENDLDLEPESETNQPPTRKPLDLSKLEEAIMNINRPGVSKQ